MISTEELERLMQTSIEDPRNEDAFCRALLDAKIFVHAPLSDMRDRPRVVTFPRPSDRLHVIPVFTSETKARWADRGGVRILKLTGRQLMSATLGATLMFNPNDVSFTLYPEEIATLLKTGTIATFGEYTTESMPGAEFYVPESVPDGLTKALRSYLPTLPFVERAYVAGLRSSIQPQGFVVILSCGRGQGERAVRALMSGISSALQDSELSIDITFVDENEPMSGPAAKLNLQPVYKRKPPISSSHRATRNPAAK